MQTVTFMRGMPASGKSTMARQICQETGAVRVNLDSIRDMYSTQWNPEREKMYMTLQDQAVINALKAGHDVVVDNTHLHVKGPKRIATILWEEAIPVQYELVDLTDVEPAECLRRNLSRQHTRAPDDSKAVPADAMERFANQIRSGRQKGFWELTDLTKELPTIEPYLWFAGDKTPCAIFDIDGTIADHRNARSPYDFAKVGMDSLHADVATMAQHLNHTRGWSIVLCSGRDAQYRPETEEWLEEYGFHYDALFMRPQGDQRRDSLIKLELFNKHIRHNYTVQCVFDDRDRVVKIWRALGLRCYQVSDGSF